MTMLKLFVITVMPIILISMTILIYTIGKMEAKLKVERNESHYFIKGKISNKNADSQV